MEIKWIIKSSNKDEALDISTKYNIPYILVKILLDRNRNKDEIYDLFYNRNKLYIEPANLINSAKVAAKIEICINSNSDICIVPDYDSDGLNSCYIIYNVINDAIIKSNSKSKVSISYSSRKNGFGIWDGYVEDKIKEYNNSKEKPLIITVDNGTTHSKQINKLIKNGFDVAVIDHHDSINDTPECLICNPCNKAEEQNQYKHLCAAGVVYKVCEMIGNIFGLEDINKYKCNVALATITDMMPLTNENLAFVLDGMNILNSDSCLDGFKMMKYINGIDYLIPRDIGWVIGPRINVCSRLDNTELGYKLISNTSLLDSAKINNEIENLNNVKKEYVSNIMGNIKEMNFDDTLIPIIIIDNLITGLISIIANQVLSLFKKPCIILGKNNNILTGSIRSIGNIDILEMLKIEYDKGLILNYGGHPKAAGVSFDYKNLDEISKDFNEYLYNIYANAEEEESVITIDNTIDIKDLNSINYYNINYLPYNNEDFTQPIFCMMNCFVVNAYPTKSNPDNIWLELCQNNMKIKLWCRNFAEKYTELNCPQYINIVGYFEKNFMDNGYPYILNVIDIKDVKEEICYE